MSTKFKTYPKYKPSGINWLGDIPEGWGLKRNRFLSFYIKGKTADLCTSDEKDCLPYLSAEVIRGQGEPEFCRGSVVAKEEQILLLWDGANAGEFFWAGPGVVSSTFSLIVPRKKNLFPKFYFWLLKGFEKILRDYTQGMGVPHVSPWILQDSFLPEVPLEEQKRIADFLDEKTKIIDELIAKKKKLIELLREKRAALITRAVTKGLNPNAKLKPSGINWLGDIPEGWQIKKIKFVADLFTGNSISDDRKPEFSIKIDGYPYISSKDIDLNYNIINYENGMYIPIDNKDFKVASKGSVLLCIEGGSAGRKIGYTNQDVCFVNKLCCVKSKKENSRFIYYFFRSKNFQDIFELHLQGLIGGVSPSKIKDFLCLLPSVGEQKQIADFLDTETAKIDKAVSLIESQIKKLKEYRSSLIYHAVTGKMKI